MACCLIFIWFNLISSGLVKRAGPCLFYCGFGLLSRAFLSNYKARCCVLMNLSSLYQIPAHHTVGVMVSTQAGTSLHGHKSSDVQAAHCGMPFTLTYGSMFGSPGITPKLLYLEAKMMAIFPSTHTILQMSPVETYL